MVRSSRLLVLVSRTPSSGQRPPSTDKLHYPEASARTQTGSLATWPCDVTNATGSIQKAQTSPDRLVSRVHYPLTMSGKIKNRSGANADLTSAGVSCDERILRDCHQLYADPESGEWAGTRGDVAGTRGDVAGTRGDVAARGAPTAGGAQGDVAELMAVPIGLTIRETEVFHPADRTVTSGGSRWLCGPAGRTRRAGRAEPAGSGGRCAIVWDHSV